MLGTLNRNFVVFVERLSVGHCCRYGMYPKVPELLGWEKFVRRLALLLYEYMFSTRIVDIIHNYALSS